MCVTLLSIPDLGKGGSEGINQMNMIYLHLHLAVTIILISNKYEFVFLIPELYDRDIKSGL